MNSLYIGYIYLFGAIISEVIGTTMLAKSEQFTKLIPTSIMVICFSCAFYLLSLSLKFIPLGVAYAIWAALGIVITAIIGITIFNQKLDTPAMIGILFIVVGVTIINIFSKTATH